jgi:hypothetical protein
MKSVNIIVIVAASLGLLGLGACLLWLGIGLQPQPDLAAWGLHAAEALEASGGLHAALGLAGLLALLLGAGLAGGNVAARRWERIIILRNPLGEVHVSLSALEDLGRVVKGDVPGLRDVKLRIQADRRGLQVRARVSLQAPEDLGAATEAVQAAIRRRLQQVVGPETDIRPRVMVAKILARSDDDDSATPRRRVRPPRP